jgi:DNA polymerase III epsilon subunit family exonuclease
MFYNLENLSKKIKKDIIVFDLETTGISKQHDCIVEFGFTHISSNIISSDNILIKPSRNIPKEVSDIHGITNEMVANCPNIVTALTPYLKLFNSPDVMFVGYNSNNFDIPFLTQELGRYNIPLDIKTALDVRDIWMAVSGVKKGKLFEVATNYGISMDMKNLHRTQADVFLTAKVCDEMLFHHGFDYVQGQIKGVKPVFNNPVELSKSLINHPAEQQTKVNFDKSLEEKKKIEEQNNAILSILNNGFEKEPDYILSERDVSFIAKKLGLTNFDVSSVIGQLISQGKIADKHVANVELQRIIVQENFVEKALNVLPDNEKTKLKPMLLKMKELLKSEGWQDHIISKLDYWQLQLAKKNNSQNVNSAFK